MVHKKLREPIPYHAAFPTGATVRVAPPAVLQQFRRPTYALHNPVTDAQVSFTGRTAVIERVGFYHGGDPLYVLEGLPGYWHEPCLEAAPQLPNNWAQWLRSQPESGMDYHLVDLLLDDGSEVRNVVIIHCHLIAEVQGHEGIPFEVDDIKEVRVAHRRAT